MLGIDRKETVEISINEMEREYLTQRILGLPKRLTRKERAAAGKSIINKVWDKKIKGDYKTINW